MNGDSGTFHDEMDVTVNVFGQDIKVRCLFVWDKKLGQLDWYPDIYDLNSDNELIKLDEAVRDEIDIQEVADQITNEITGVNYV